MNRVTKVAAITAAAVFTAITLSACGSDPATETTTEATTETTTETTTAPETMQVGNIVEVATQAGTFNTLVAALSAADLATTLSGEGPFTVFAPTEEAFAALPAGVLDALLLPANKAVLAQVLSYHVLPGRVAAADITDSEVDTVEGSKITLSTANGVTVNGAKVLAADIEASNGLIHVVDTVILVPGLDLTKLLKK